MRFCGTPTLDATCAASAKKVFNTAANTSSGSKQVSAIKVYFINGTSPPTNIFFDEVLADLLASLFGVPRIVPRINRPKFSEKHHFRRDIFEKS